MKLIFTKIKMLIYLVCILIIYCSFLQYKTLQNKIEIKCKLDSLKTALLEKNSFLKIQKALKDTFQLSEDKAAICAILIDKSSKRWNVEWEKIASSIRVESNFNYYAKGPLTRGSKSEPLQRVYGLMQLKPTTAKMCADELGIEWNGLETVLNPVDNILLGTYYYAKMNLIFNDFRKSINAYNGGPQAVYKKYESINHWYRILYHYKRLKGESDSALTEIVKKLDEEFIEAANDSLNQEIIDDTLQSEIKINKHRTRKRK